MSKCHNIRLQTPIFPTPQKSYARFFWGAEDFILVQLYYSCKKKTHFKVIFSLDNHNVLKYQPQNIVGHGP